MIYGSELSSSDQTEREWIGAWHVYVGQEGGCVTIPKCLFVSSLIVCTSGKIHPKRRERPETGRMVKR